MKKMMLKKTRKTILITNQINKLHTNDLKIKIKIE